MANAHHKVTIEAGCRTVPYRNTTWGQLFTRSLTTGDKNVYLSRRAEGPINLTSGLSADYSIKQDEEVYPLIPGARVVIVVGEQS